MDRVKTDSRLVLDCVRAEFDSDDPTPLSVDQLRKKLGLARERIYGALVLLVIDGSLVPSYTLGTVRFRIPSRKRNKTGGKRPK